MRSALRMLGRQSPVLHIPFGAKFSSASKFNGFNVHARIVAALNENGIHKPTPIQAKSINAILSGQNVLCAAQTGTGKTLAFLVPSIEKVIRTEESSTLDPATVNSRPQVVILLPSRELALQVGSVAKQLAHTAKFASCVITSGERKNIQVQKLSRRVDILVGTPGRIAHCIKNNEFFLSKVHTVILDEADTLLDARRGFLEELDKVLKPIQNSASRRGEYIQTILAAATVQPKIEKVIRKSVGDLNVISDDKLHHLPAALKERFVRVGRDEKHPALRDALSTKQKSIVFCRDASSCRSTEHTLREKGYEAVSLHGEMPPARRHEALDAFHGPDAQVLVCTDLAARGLHFDAVDHVILFDFPQSVVDYVHRAGRTGRNGAPGLVTSLITKYDMKLAKQIEDAKRQHLPLEDRQPTYEKPKVDVIKAKKPSRIGRGTKKLKAHKLRTER